MEENKLLCSRQLSPGPGTLKFSAMMIDESCCRLHSFQIYFPLLSVMMSKRKTCIHFLGAERPSQSSYRLNLSSSLSAVEDNVNISDWGQTASLSLSCLNFKHSSEIQFWAVTHFSPAKEDQDFFFSLLFLCMCCVCCCHWIQSEWGLSRCCTERHTHSKGMCQDWVSPGYASHTAMQTQLTRTVNRIRQLNKVSMSRKNSAMHKQAGWEKVQIDKRSYGNYHSVKKSTQLERKIKESGCKGSYKCSFV